MADMSTMRSSGLAARASRSWFGEGIANPNPNPKPSLTLTLTLNLTLTAN